MDRGAGVLVAGDAARLGLLRGVQGGHAVHGALHPLRVDAQRPVVLRGGRVGGREAVSRHAGRERGLAGDGVPDDGAVRDGLQHAARVAQRRAVVCDRALRARWRLRTEPQPRQPHRLRALRRHARPHPQRVRLQHGARGPAPVRDAAGGQAALRGGAQAARGGPPRARRPARGRGGAAGGAPHARLRDARAAQPAPRDERGDRAVGGVEAH
mmetsp:Transcript_12549/g.43918  ORF Transcript_12549/g.43918 Transcript_12549/m.43918 type:complete len:212 (+) Transcript_12549:708-1343(+)